MDKSSHQITQHHSSKSIRSATDKAMEVTNSACHRALTNLLILSNVFPFIENDDTCLFYKEMEHQPSKAALEEGASDSYTQYGVLLRCALVNKFWWKASVPFIWRDLLQEDATPQQSMSELLSQVPEDAKVDEQVSRRQYYAKFIEVAIEKIQGQNSLKDDPDYDTKRDELLKSLEFPRLRVLDLRYVVGSTFPALDLKNASALKQISWSVPVYNWGYDETFYGDPQMDVQNMLESISRSFPDIEVIKIRGYSGVLPGYLEKFKEKMKNLQTFEHELQEEESYYLRHKGY